jgi:ribonuclease HI
MPSRETPQPGHPEPSRRNYLLNTDGSGTGTIGDPAQAAIGVVLRDPGGHLIAEISKRIGPAINTVAEYRALIEGLKLARSRGIQRIRVFLDSELVVDQVNGRAKVGKEHIRPLHTEACSLLQEFSNIRISWVPRKWNAEADALASKALLDR